MAVKSREQQVADAKNRLDKLFLKKEQISRQIKKEENFIRRLITEQQEEKARAVIKRIEISGIDLDDVLNELQRRSNKEG
ncbi:hypothetical protein [Sinanaerobacter sp. ZZT-01]|uniref:hypothetical protein n=1 Tax=Sinanaerobacter sp. ZZT-01 TaxID=3111540 RepID=UPI002D76C619|nr:hypothetical protein [Sinanaerobacter sp. ZZT-01]WRR94236.1 hypothetical protein U5921_03705 [Sinanaerobacter sp. ZZT-01]